MQLLYPSVWRHNITPHAGIIFCILCLPLICPTAPAKHKRTEEQQSQQATVIAAAATGPA
jgi:hypothetical protein